MCLCIWSWVVWGPFFISLWQKSTYWNQDKWLRRGVYHFKLIPHKLTHRHWVNCNMGSWIIRSAYRYSGVTKVKGIKRFPRMVRSSVRQYGLRPTQPARDNIYRVEIACGMQSPEKCQLSHLFLTLFLLVEASSALYFWDHHTPIQIVAIPIDALDTTCIFSAIISKPCAKAWGLQKPRIMKVHQNLLSAS